MCESNLFRPSKCSEDHSLSTAKWPISNCFAAIILLVHGWNVRILPLHGKDASDPHTAPDASSSVITTDASPCVRFVDRTKNTPCSFTLDEVGVSDSLNSKLLCNFSVGLHLCEKRS